MITSAGGCVVAVILSNAKNKNKLMYAEYLPDWLFMVVVAVAVAISVVINLFYFMFFRLFHFFIFWRAFN